MASMERHFYQELLNWKAGGMRKPLLVLGARQVGKTYLIDQFCAREFRHYRQLNLFEEPLLKQLYQSNLSSKSKFEQLEMIVGFKPDNADSVLFIDEVQESEELISELKYLQEKQPQVNIVCAGSLLGVKLKRFKKSFPVGKVQIKNMYPLSFPEFLLATENPAYVQQIQRCYQGNETMLPTMHEELMRLHRIYICIGGMPEAVQHYLDKGHDLQEFDNSFFDTLKTACIDDMKKYVSNQNEAVKIERIYDSIPLQQANKSHKFQYSKIRSGGRANQYETALDWLMAAGLTYKTDCVTEPEKPIRHFVDLDVFKLFSNDVGLLTRLLQIDFRDIMLDRLGQAKGYLAESYVACELSAKDMPLYYWRSQNNAEVDFLIQNEDGVIPIEVKAAQNVQSKSLGVYCQKYKPAYAVRVSAKNFGFANGIKSLPLYAAFCL
jgi:predicted AAA+ superfamily ATPase